MTRVLGLDLSLTATGYAYTEEVVGVVRPKSTGPARLIEIRDNILELAHVADVVVLEGYGFASQKAVVQGELGGVIRVTLHERRIPYAVVAPASLKKFATGKGNADKGAMIAAAIRRFGFEGDNDNAADAWMLRAMGLAAYTHEGFVEVFPGDITQAMSDALGKVEWPKLGAVVT